MSKIWRGSVAFWLIPGLAYAHDLTDRYGPFLGAALHPLTELDHVFPFLAIGLLAGQQGAPAARRMVGAFLAALLIGTVAPGVVAVPEDIAQFLSVFNLASFIVLGALVAAAPRVPARPLILLAALFGASHGLENGLDLDGILSALSVAGVMIAGLVTTVPVAAIVSRLRAGWPLIAVRVAGSWIAAIGLLVLGLRFRT